MRLGAGGEGRAVHADIGAAVVNTSPGGPGFLGQQGTQTGGDGIGERDVGDDAPAKEGVVLAAAGAVKELIGQDDVARLVFLLQAAHGGDGDDPAHVQGAQRPDVGTVIEFGGQDAVPFAVPWQEKHSPAGQRAADDFVRRRAERRVHLDLLAVGESVDVIEAGAADDADSRGECREVSHGRNLVCCSRNSYGFAGMCER